MLTRHDVVDDVELTVRGDDGWWCIERAEHDGRTWMEYREVSNLGRVGHYMISARLGDLCSDIEGSGAEMLAIADAIDHQSRVEFKRCAAEWVSDGVLLWSPRNSGVAAIVPHARAAALASAIRRAVTPSSSNTSPEVV